MYRKKELSLILFFIFVFIAIRSIHFPYYLNFSFDQAWGATRVLDIWNNKELTLVGPGSSIVASGKTLLQGSINYYSQLVFLLLGNFDPVKSSYALMIYMAIMIIPLYYGAKLLLDEKSAFFVIIVYSLFPYFIDFSRFFFGPVYQLSLVPFILLSMGLYRRRKRWLFLFLTFFLIGIHMQFHYQTIVIIFALSFYYLLRNKNKKMTTLVILLGLIIGYLPMIVFELKNEFYNVKILTEYIIHSKKSNDLFFAPHRYLSISVFPLVVLVFLFKKYITTGSLVLIFFLFLTSDLYLYRSKPDQAFGMSPNWNYLMEKKAYEIIRREKVKNYNVVNLIYDNLSAVIKYHLRLDGVKIKYDDYYHNEYLFIINNDENIFNEKAYEVATFKPNKKIKEWRLNDTYNLYLYKRLN